MLEKMYNRLIEPSTLIKHFNSESEFRDWLAMGTQQDLMCTLEVFEQSQMYEECMIIKDVIDGRDL